MGSKLIAFRLNTETDADILGQLDALGSDSARWIRAVLRGAIVSQEAGGVNIVIQNPQAGGVSDVNNVIQGFEKLSNERQYPSHRIPHRIGGKQSSGTSTPEASEPTYSDDF